MDPFAYLPQIKLLATLALGYLCYRNINQHRIQQDYFDEELSESPSHDINLPSSLINSE